MNLEVNFIIVGMGLFKRQADVFRLKKSVYLEVTFALGLARLAHSMERTYYSPPVEKIDGSSKIILAVVPQSTIDAPR